MPPGRLTASAKCVLSTSAGVYIALLNSLVFPRLHIGISVRWYCTKTSSLYCRIDHCMRGCDNYDEGNENDFLGILIKGPLLLIQFLLLVWCWFPTALCWVTPKQTMYGSQIYWNLRWGLENYSPNCWRFASGVIPSCHQSIGFNRSPAKAFVRWKIP